MFLTPLTRLHVFLVVKRGDETISTRWRRTDVSRHARQGRSEVLRQRKTVGTCVLLMPWLHVK